MFYKNQINRKRFFALLAFMLVLITSLFILSGCCHTSVVFGVVRGPSPPSEKTGGGTSIFICPGEPVTLGWEVSNDVTQATISNIGPVSLTKGFVTVYPTETTKYTIVVKGNCKRTQFCMVNVIQSGTKRQISANLVTTISPSANLPKKYHWDRTITEDTTSPNIYFTSIRMIKFADSSWNQSAQWDFIKTNVDGSVVNFPVTWAFTTPWGPTNLQVIGNWQIYPIGGEYPNNNIPNFANFEGTMVCKGN